MKINVEMVIEIHMTTDESFCTCLSARGFCFSTSFDLAEFLVDSMYFQQIQFLFGLKHLRSGFYLLSKTLTKLSFFGFLL